MSVTQCEIRLPEKRPLLTVKENYMLIDDVEAPSAGYTICTLVAHSNVCNVSKWLLIALAALPLSAVNQMCARIICCRDIEGWGTFFPPP